MRGISFDRAAKPIRTSIPFFEANNNKSRGTDSFLTIFDKNIVHNIKHSHAHVLGHRREPGRRPQSSARIGKSLLPAGFHRGAAELKVFEYALGLERAVDKLGYIHFGDTAMLIQPSRLFRISQIRRQQFVQLINGMSYVVLVTNSVRAHPRSASIPNILIAFADFIEIARQPAMGNEHVDLKNEAASARIIVDHVL